MPPEPTATQLLLQRVRDGDQEAWNDLYNRYGLRAYPKTVPDKLGKLGNLVAAKAAANGFGIGSYASSPVPCPILDDKNGSRSHGKRSPSSGGKRA